jgi:hypothetical protein
MLHPHGMLDAHDVAVAQYQKSGGPDGLELRRRPALELAHPLYALGEEDGQLLGMRRGSEVRLLQLERHVVELRVLEPLPESRVGAVAAEEGRLDDERTNDLRIPERDLQRDVAAVAVAEEVRF